MKIKFISLLVSITFIIGIIHPLESAEIAIKIPFGPGSHPKNKNIIEKLKDEETGGAGTAIALILLGVCIVAAAVIIANKADDIKDDVNTKYDKEKQDALDRYNEEKERERQEEEEKNRDEEGNTNEEPPSEPSEPSE